jgi:hypothetical protein
MATPRSQSMLKATKWTWDRQTGETEEQLFNELAYFQMNKKAVVPSASPDSPDNTD